MAILFFYTVLFTYVLAYSAPRRNGRTRRPKQVLRNKSCGATHSSPCRSAFRRPNATATPSPTGSINPRRAGSRLAQPRSSPNGENFNGLPRKMSEGLGNLNTAEAQAVSGELSTIMNDPDFFEPWD